ncbi:hypothetical protein VPH35_113622 [Triticum aestivum]
MANVAKAAAIFFVSLQVGCAVARHHADPRTSLDIVTVPGTMMRSGFDQGQERGPSSCSGTYHTDMEPVITVSTKIYTSGGLCGILFRITNTETGRSTTAEVVDECQDCLDDEVGGSAGVWKDLGLDNNAGSVPVILSW